MGVQDVAVGLGGGLEPADLVGGVDGVDQVPQAGVAELVLGDSGDRVGQGEPPRVR